MSNNKFVVDAEAEVRAEVQTLNVTDEIKVISVEAKAVPTPAPAPPDEFWIVLSAVSALLTLLVAV
jgi:hypothetical protein